MNTYADKTQDNKSQSVASTIARKQGVGESIFQFVDNRPESIAQKKLQDMANNSRRIKQLRAFHGVTNQDEVVQRAFVYRHELKRIVEDSKPNSYYKNIKFTAIPTNDGRTIWCNSLNAMTVLDELRDEGLSPEIPDLAEDIQETGVNIEQDGYREYNPIDQEYYYIGHGLAWTTRIRTCTALAIYDNVSHNSFLCHADGGKGNLARIITHLEQYLQQVPDQQFADTLTINIFTAPDTSNYDTSSLTVVLNGLRAVALQHDKIMEVLPDATVAVFPGGPARSLPPTKSLLQNALANYCKEPSEQGKDYILDILTQKPALAEDVYNELLMCYSVLEQERKESSFLLRYLSDEDIERLKYKEGESESSQSPETKKQVAVDSTPSSTYDPLKHWADYSDDEP